MFLEKRAYSLSTFFYFGAASVISTFYYMFLQQKVDLSLGDIATVTSFGAVFSLLSQPLLGYLFTKCKKKKNFMKIYVLGLILVLSMMLIVKENWIFIFAIFYGSIAIPMIGTYEIYIEALANYKGVEYSKIRKWGSIGMGSITLIGGGIISNFSFKGFHVLGIVFLFFCIVLIHKYFIIMEDKFEKKKVKWNTIFSQKYIKRLYLICFMGIGSYVGADFAFSSYLTQISDSVKLANQLFSLSTGIKIFLEFLFFIIISKIWKKYNIKSLFLSTFLFSGLRFLFISTGILPIVILGDLLHCIVFPMFLTIIFPYLRCVVKEESVAGCYSVISMLMFGFSNFIYPTFFSWIADSYGYQSMYLSNVVFAVLTVVIGSLWLPQTIEYKLEV